jgi:hypothetical protein
MVEPPAKEVPLEGPAIEPTTEPVPPVLDADDPLDDLDVDGLIEVVDELIFEHAVDESPEAPVALSHVDNEPATLESEPPAAEDPFVVLVRVLEDVALASGAGEEALVTLRMLLGRTRLEAGAAAEMQQLRAQAAAWQVLLRGDDGDFDACGGAMLDDWSARLLATVLGQASRVDGIKRELRRLGVAAFGIVEQAA